MATSFSPAQIEYIRREAKKVSRELSVTHSEALDRIAARHGFKNWSLLAKHSDGGASQRPPQKGSATASEGRRRYYLHGDLVEDDPSHCYCARCDMFVDLTHFDQSNWHSDSTDSERYLASLARWQRLPEAQRHNRRRSDDSPNILAERAHAEKSAFEASRSPFHRWLQEQRDRNDPVGDLATDVLRDKSFPVGAATRREARAYLSRYGEHVLLALRQAWREFSAQQGEATARRPKGNRESLDSVIDPA